jgi:glycosyltransferase involved in cell wall biosynthesis
MHRNNTTAARRILIAEHMDPINLTPGGIDSIVADMVKFGGTAYQFSIVGAARNESVPLGQWTKIDFAGREVDYLPVAHIDRSAVTGFRSRVPHSLLFAMGLLRHRRKLVSGEYHAHRIETGFVLLLLLRCRLIQFIHNDSRGLLGSGSDSTWRKAAGVYRRLEAWVAKRADRMVLFNRADSVRLIKHRPDLIVSRTWFDPEVFMQSPLQEPENKPSMDLTIDICWVGRMDAQKDPALAIDVVAEMLDQGLKPHLRMVGDGVLADSMRSRIRDQGLGNVVELLGACSRQQVASIMSASDALLMTSRYEGSPIVLLEAGASGLPVIATEESDPDTALISGINGERVSDRNPVDIASALGRVASYSRNECTKMAASRSGRVSVPILLRSIETD